MFDGRISKCRALERSVEEKPVWPELGRYQGEGRTMRAELWPRPSGQGSKPDGCCVCLQKWLSWTIGCNVGCGRSDRENS